MELRWLPESSHESISIHSDEKSAFNLKKENIILGVLLQLILYRCGIVAPLLPCGAPGTFQCKDTQNTFSDTTFGAPSPRILLIQCPALGFAKETRPRPTPYAIAISYSNGVEIPQRYRISCRPEFQGQLGLRARDVNLCVIGSLNSPSPERLLVGAPQSMLVCSWLRPGVPN